MTCIEIVKTPWDIDQDDNDQPRYRVNEWYIYIYWRYFKGFNNWRAVDLVTTSIPSTMKENAYEIILYGIKVWTNERILKGKFGATRTNDKAMQGYYLIEWLSESYTVQENIVMNEVDMHQDLGKQFRCNEYR